jgi:Ca2+-binding EF-hand superfamily protein
MTVSGVSAGQNSFQAARLAAMRDKLFQKSDADKNGTLSLDEFLSAGQNVPVGSNSPGASGAQDTSAATDLFKKIDTNSDGQISKDEVSAFQDKLSAQIQAALTQLQELFGNDQSGKKAHHHGHRDGSISDLFSKIDADSDGAISKSEFTAFPVDGQTSTTDASTGTAASDKLGKLFDAIDTNGDGALSKDEVAAFDASRKARHAAHAARGNDGNADDAIRGTGTPVSIDTLLQAIAAYSTPRSNRTGGTTTSNSLADLLNAGGAKA